MEKEERVDIYTIPPNFAEEGTMLSGRIKTRNAVETAILLSVLIPVICSLELSTKAKLYIAIIVVVPVVLIAVIGVQGESLFAFIGSFFRFLLHRRLLTVPDEKYRMEQNRIKERKQRGGKRTCERKHNRGKKRAGREKTAERTIGKADGKKGEETVKPGMEEKTEGNQAGGQKRTKGKQ
ncbi:hypothetical protein ACTM9N_03035 [Lachnospiraceae bacterium HCP1S3_A8]